MKIQGYNIDITKRKNRVNIVILDKNTDIVVFRHNVSKEAFEKHEDEICDTLINVLEKRKLLLYFLEEKGFKHIKKSIYEMTTKIKNDKYKVNQKARICLPVINHVRKKTSINQQYDYMFVQFLFETNILYKKTYIFKISREDILRMYANDLFEKYFEIEKIKNGL